ncbi:DUF4241 domain-containing protein [Oryzihumus leptocrescens]|uniref:DUF4241 domain-containing protein n=1 Tax=Oryzihumus leptocrescens TaxID=297536 RepID=UPI001639DC81|nr:DUF4241 domain-containing protein [Oryzihumus leptocrescens]
MTALPAQSVQTESSDPWWKLRAGWIYAAIVAGELRDHGAKDEVRYVVRQELIGRLALPGGRLVAADPYVMGADPQPFVQLLGAEAAEVVAARAVIGEGHERVAALVLHVGPTAVCDWVMATVDGQDVATLDGEGYFGYPVDAGTGSFGSPDAMKTVGRVLFEDGGMLEDPVSEALLGDGVGTDSAAVVAPEPGATPVAVCSSGWGDGSYPTWIGVDGSGEVTVVVTDFLLTTDPFAVRLSPPAEEPPAARPKSLLRRWLGA